MLWPNPAVTLIAARIRKPLYRRHRDAVNAAFEKDNSFRSLKKEGAISAKEAAELAYVELVRVLLDHTEFLERYAQISILYTYAALGWATKHEVAVLRERPWQV